MVKMKQHIYQAPDPKVRVAYTVLKAYAIAQRCPPSQRAVAYVLAHENAQPKPVGCNLTKLRTRRKKWFAGFALTGWNSTEPFKLSQPVVSLILSSHGVFWPERCDSLPLIASTRRSTQGPGSQSLHYILRTAST